MIGCIFQKQREGKHFICLFFSIENFNLNIIGRVRLRQLGKCLGVSVRYWGLGLSRERARSGAVNMEGSVSEWKTKSQRRLVGLLYDERMCKHHTPDDDYHPENPNRIRSIWNKLQSAGIHQRYTSFYFVWVPGNCEGKNNEEKKL